MSIFTKVVILFFFSFVLMFFLSMKTNEINDKKIELIYKEKYLQTSKEFFNYFINDNIKILNKRVKDLNYQKIEKVNLTSFTILNEENISFGTIKIIKHQGSLYLYMKYLDDEALFYDLAQDEELDQKKILNYLIYADLFLLIIIFLIVIQILRPLQYISQAIERFGKGDYGFRLKRVKNKDEISKVIDEFNTMANNLETLNRSRTQFLSDISHELRTPIAKGKLALEMIEDSKYKTLLQKSLQNMDQLTNELLQIEKLNANKIEFDFKNYTIETILANSFSKMIIDEENLDVTIKESFELIADINLISIAIKNLIDNALKYNDSKDNEKIVVEISTDKISILSKGEKLTKPLDFYTQTFTKDDNSRSNIGYGLGLNIVKRILDIHQFSLQYAYQNGFNIFTIITH